MLQHERTDQQSAGTGRIAIDLSGAETGHTPTVITLLSDADCRELLATADTPMTAAELIDACDIPRATVYRKLNRLADAGLVGTSRRLRKQGRSPTEYQRQVDQLLLRSGDVSD
jgi:response regulator of citrate/malate metabolism